MSERTRVLKKTGQSEVLSSGLRFENFSKKNSKKVCKFRKKPYLCNPDSERGLRPENDPRLDPRTQNQIVFLNYFEMDARRTK